MSTITTCECDLRDSRWDPNTATCETCGAWTPDLWRPDARIARLTAERDQLLVDRGIANQIHADQTAELTHLRAIEAALASWRQEFDDHRCPCCDDGHDDEDCTCLDWALPVCVEMLDAIGRGQGPTK